MLITKHFWHTMISITETFCKIKSVKQVWNRNGVRNDDTVHIWRNYPFKFLMLLQRMMGNVVL